MSTFSDETLQLSGGITTAWLPISTPWPSLAECSAQIYSQRADLGGNLIAFDPVYREKIVTTAIPCLPAEVTSSWRQSNSGVTTLLGPTFVCPAAYSAVATLSANPQLEQVLCCPSEYGLNVAITEQNTFPSQCTSKLKVGETLGYESTTTSGPWGRGTSTVVSSTTSSDGPTVVFAMHVNGFNSVTSTSSVSSEESSSSGATSRTTTSIVSTPISTLVPGGSNKPVSSSSLSSGAVAGISVSAVVVAIAAVVAIWVMMRKRSQRNGSLKRTPGMLSEKRQIPHEMDSETRPVELDGRRRDTMLQELEAS